MRRRNPKPILLISIVLLIVISGFIAYQFTPSVQAKKIVQDFYSYEQSGDFDDSWELLHPQIMDRLDKFTYLETRSKMLLLSFDVNTFSYEVGHANKMKNWAFEKNGNSFDVVYEFPVTLAYESKFGNFTIQQKVYVTMEEDEWRILWDYK
ncbi:hypothetical protein RZN22_01480 [Bacillaceae bacterium S4-13-58]